jgi:TPR repeat protein
MNDFGGLALFGVELVGVALLSVACCPAPRASDSPANQTASVQVASPASASEASTPVAPEQVTPTQVEEPVDDQCPTQDERRQGASWEQEATSILDSCDEQCMKSVEGGKDRRRGMDLLRRAAHAGSLSAQQRYGQTLFGDLMTTGSEPELEDDYVEAIAFLRVAARRGADEYLPGLSRLQLSEDGSLQPAADPPLSDLPPGWVVRGIREGDELMHCFDD